MRRTLKCLGAQCNNEDLFDKKCLGAQCNNEGFLIQRFEQGPLDIINMQRGEKRWKHSLLLKVCWVTHWMAPCLGLPRGPFIQGGVGRCCPNLDWHRSPPHALPVLVTEGSNPQQSRHQSSRVAPAPLGRDTNAKTSPAPPAAVLITRSRRAEQASKKLQESPKVRAEPGGKKVYICIYRGQESY